MPNKNKKTKLFSLCHCQHQWDRLQIPNSRHCETISLIFDWIFQSRWMVFFVNIRFIVASFCSGYGVFLFAQLQMFSGPIGYIMNPLSFLYKHLPNLNFLQYIESNINILMRVILQYNIFVKLFTSWSLDSIPPYPPVFKKLLLEHLVGLIWCYIWPKNFSKKPTTSLWRSKRKNVKQYLSNFQIFLLHAQFAHMQFKFKLT